MITYFLFCFFISDDDYPPVGFTAFTTSSQTPDNGMPVLFPSIISNIGDHYNDITSRFTCPYNGLYLFSLTIQAYGYIDAIADIMRENDFLVEVMALYDNYYAQASAFIIEECHIGQTVWVRCADSTSYFYSTSDRNSHFSGALLYAYV